MLYQYYSRIFFKQNNAKDFNRNLIFPFIATILCSVITITTYSIMQSLEDIIIDKIVAINNHSRVYIELDGEDFDRNYQTLSDFLETKNKEHGLFIEGKGLLSYSNGYLNENNSKIVKVIGIRDIEEIREKFKLNLKNLINLKGKILIGEELSDFLSISDNQNKISIFAPLDGFLFPPFKAFTPTQDRFKFANINAIDNISANYVFIDYHEATQLFKNTRSYIGIKDILDKEELDFIHNNIEKVKYEDWKNTYPLFFSALKVEKYLYTSFGFLLIFIASFNLYGIINLIIYRKKNQLAILIYKGESLKNIKKIFTANILLIGGIGSFIGILIAYLLLKFNVLNFFTPILENINPNLTFVPFSLFLNLFLLYIGTHVAIKNSSKKIMDLRSNAIES